MTADEGNAISGFLQALALSLESLLCQASPQDRRMENFQGILDGYLEAAADHPMTRSPAAAAGMRELKRVLYREIDRMPLHRLGQDASRN